MKIKNKIVCLVALSMLVIATGCQSTGGNDEKVENDVKLSKEEIYQKAIETLNEAKYFDVTMVVDSKMNSTEATGTEENINMSLYSEVTTLVDLSDKENPSYKVDAHVKMFGMDVKTTQYYVDGYSYTEALGMKAKTKVTTDEFSELTYIPDSDTLPGEIDVFEFEETEDAYVYKIDSTDEVINFIQNIDGMDDIINLEDDLLSNGGAIENAYIELVISKEYKVLSQKISLKVNAVEEGNKLVVDMAIEAIFNSINEPLEIVVPNEEEYKEQTEE